MMIDSRLHHSRQTTLPLPETPKLNEPKRPIQLNHKNHRSNSLPAILAVTTKPRSLIHVSANSAELIRRQSLFSPKSFAITHHRNPLICTIALIATAQHPIRVDESNPSRRSDLMVKQKFFGIQHGPEDVFQGFFFVFLLVHKSDKRCRLFRSWSS